MAHGDLAMPTPLTMHRNTNKTQHLNHTILDPWHLTTAVTSKDTAGTLQSMMHMPVLWQLGSGQRCILTTCNALSQWW